jgi:hypothetical protein
MTLAFESLGRLDSYPLFKFGEFKSLFFNESNPFIRNLS